MNLLLACKKLAKMFVNVEDFTEDEDTISEVEKTSEDLGEEDREEGEHDS